jgi:hypothetical protein
MSSPQTAPIATSQAAIAANIQAPSTTNSLQRTVEPAFTDALPKQKGYGLPCLKCKTYYAADLKSCPVCKSSQRVAPLSTLPCINVPAEELPDPIALEQERERFLREFKLNVDAAKLETEAAGVTCSKNENHKGTAAPASVCQGCYDHLQERVDVLEAVLHMDLKEAAEVIYDAVWSDPSDPSKTYLNAASAILSELRRRSGVAQIFGPLQPLSD